jgi:hypothetical protein
MIEGAHSVAPLAVPPVDTVDPSDSVRILTTLASATGYPVALGDTSNRLGPQAVDAGTKIEANQSAMWYVA